GKNQTNDQNDDRSHQPDAAFTEDVIRDCGQDVHSGTPPEQPVECLEDDVLALLTAGLGETLQYTPARIGDFANPEPRSLPSRFPYQCHRLGPELVIFS